MTPQATAFLGKPVFVKGHLSAYILPRDLREAEQQAPKDVHVVVPRTLHENKDCLCD